MQGLEHFREAVCQEAKKEAALMIAENSKQLEAWKREVEEETEQEYVLLREQLKKENQKQKSEFQAHLNIRYRKEILEEKQRAIHEAKQAYFQWLCALNAEEKSKLYLRLWENLKQKHKELSSLQTLHIALPEKDKALLPLLEKNFASKLLLKEEKATWESGFRIYVEEMCYDATLEQIFEEKDSEWTLLINQKLFLEQKGEKK